MDHPEVKKDLRQAKIIVLRFLKYRLRSEWEIREKLKAKEFSDDVIRATVESFQKISLIDDRLFARGWIRSRLNKPFGITRIRRELTQKKVAADIINDELSQAREDYQETEALRALAQRRMKQYRDLAKPQKQRRLFFYLTRRGFPFESVQKIVKEMTSDDDR